MQPLTENFERHGPGPETVRVRTWRQSNPVKKMLQNARYRCGKTGMAFDLVEADLLPLPTHCPVLGTRLRYLVPGRNLLSADRYDCASLDRKDNTKGYVRGNVAIISLRANLLKGNGTAAEHRAIAQWMET